MARYDLQAVRSAAASRWIDLISQIGAIRPEWLDGRPHPCPKCGGRDRFRLIDAEAGAVLCNQCFRSRNGDGFAAIMWLTGQPFSAVLARVADFCGISPSKSQAVEIDPAKDLEFRAWNDQIAALWCLRKRGITPQALSLVGARLATYRKRHTVIALPVWGQYLDKTDPVGWCLFAANGGTLPKWAKDKDPEQVKVKLTYGSKPGVMGIIRHGDLGIKTEGPTDLLSLLSLADLPADVSAVCNANGCGENPDNTPWIAGLFAGMQCWVIHDCDLPGQQGATEVPRHDGSSRPGWAQCLARSATECRNVVLPYPIEKDHGKDLRDWLREPHTFADLAELAKSSPPVPPASAAEETKPNESDDDYHRLARVNLEEYASRHGGRTLRYWRDEWYVWKDTHYRRITEKELKAKITYSVKREFDRINIVQLEEYSRKKSAGELEEGEKPPFAKKVSIGLVSSVLNATAGMTHLSSSIDPMTWLPTRERRNYVAMANAIIDMDAVIADRDDYQIQHSPDWFSTTCLPYSFRTDATCPKWEAFLENNLEMDPERIKLLQEWAGYLLLPDTGQQKFLVLEGEGANGKSVYCAGIEAMLGAANVSHIPLETFGEKFELTATLDKLANICGDAGEIDKVAEGHIKAFTAGNPMSFGRKYLEPVERTPTARLMLACNNRPRFSDKSDGIWRRMLLVPWRIQIAPEDRIPNMDKPWWWEQSGECPGILLWAIQGLHRLQQQGRFTRSEVCEEALGDYRTEMNPARSFLADHCISNSASKIRTAKIYSLYSLWSRANGHHPLSERQFGKEVLRFFLKSKKERSGTGSREYYYRGICFSCDEICGESVSDALFF